MQSLRTLALAFLCAVSLLSAVEGTGGVVNNLAGGLAVGGYDVVAYFTDQKAVPGSADHIYDYQGATWRFASAEHRQQLKQFRTPFIYACPKTYAHQDARMTQSRSDLLGGDGSGDGVWVHAVSRCVRRAFLCGEDRGRKLDHRKDWIEQRLRLLAEQGAVEVAGYAVMSNHLHAVLRVRADWAAGWSAKEVARRYLTIFAKRRTETGVDLAPTDAEVAQAAKGPQIPVWRGRLANLGWLMRSVKEWVARRANAEDQCSGAFWEKRYTSVPLLDQAALIACMAYVDLNPIRAKICDRPERSRHTSIRARIRGRQGFRAQQTLRAAGQAAEAAAVAVKAGLSDAPRHQEDGLWVAPLSACVAGPPNRPSASPLTSDDYLTLVDATGRLLRDGKRGRIPPGLLPILKRLNLDLTAWLATMQGWREFLGRVVGSVAARVAAAATLARQGRQWFQNRCTLFRVRTSGASAA